MSVTVALAPDNEKQCESIWRAAFATADPTEYMALNSTGYRPVCPELPSYCNTVLDCGALFGNTSLACMYGWDFNRSCEFWKAGVALSEKDRQHTLLNRRLKMIGLDVMPLALDYAKKMNILDETIVQDFRERMLDETRAALQESDVWIIQQCMHYMPKDTLSCWMNVFLQDRTRPKCFMYDALPDYDTRNMKPDALLEGVTSYTHTETSHIYRQWAPDEKTVHTGDGGDGEGDDMYLYYYVVNFQPLDSPA